jgi:hypothetical protein
MSIESFLFPTSVGKFENLFFSNYFGFTDFSTYVPAYDFAL